MKMWAGRFQQSLDPEFENWQRSFAFDRRLLGHELAASRAHARALESAGVLAADELKAILRGLDQIGQQAAASSEFGADSQAEDVHHFVESQLVGLIGETGFKLHSGRSRNEQIAADLRLYVREAIDQLRSELAELCDVFLERAERSGTSAMPAYTHLQCAEPVLVAHWLLAYVEMFFRDSERLAEVRQRTNLSPLGSGAVAGATLALERDAMAEDLACHGITANSIDATSDRDFVVEFVNALALLALHLSRWAEEMILFSSAEFGFVDLPEAYSTGSSAMPQKKNPDLAELVRAKSARVIGQATALLVTLKALPLAYHKDLQETQEPLYAAWETVRALLPLVRGWMQAAEFDSAHMRERAQSGFMNAWAAATYLVKRGLPSRLAHEVVGRAVQLCLKSNCELKDLSLDQLHRLSPVFAEDFYQGLGLDAVLALHDVPGGTAPARVRQALSRARQKVDSLREKVHAHA
ncbi:MAG TPA: argininosuccinate lyase [Terriglobales bacterium]|nr:argininosuccinate lyase [Terriglobales bacterium]